MSVNGSRQTKKDENHFINSTLFALLTCCPLSNGPHKNCSFKEYRTGGSHEEKYLFIEGLHETSRLHLLALHNKCIEMATGNYQTLNSEHDVNVEKWPKSLQAKYCLVKTALEETIRERRPETFNKKVPCGR